MEASRAPYILQLIIKNVAKILMQLIAEWYLLIM
jgi:hypothetical protein